MRPWERETRETPFAELPESTRTAIAGYAERHALGDVAGAVRTCTTTTSTQAKSFGRKEVVESFALATPELVVWGRIGDPSPGCAKRSEVEVREYAGQLVPDTGIELFGFLLGGAERMTAFIGLGAGPAADRLRAELGVS